MPSDSESKLDAKDLSVLEWIAAGRVSSSYAEDLHVVRLLSLKFVTLDGDYLVTTPLGDAFLQDT
jgi:hypothetical protein